MLLTRPQLIAKLAAANIATANVTLFAPDQVQGNLFGTVSADFIQRAWDGFIDLLQADPNATLTMPRLVGGGKTIIVPNYVAPGGVCRHWAFAFFGFLMLCFIKQQAARIQQNDAYAVAVVYYTATPRPADLGRNGRHARIFYVNDDGNLAQFEEGDGDPEPMTPGELASITFELFV